MRENKEKIYNQACDKYGDPFTLTASGSIGTINAKFFAAFFKMLYHIIYYIPEKKFYLYNKKNGIWENIYINLLSERLVKFFRVFENMFNVEGVVEKANMRTLREVTEFLKGMCGDVQIFINGYQGPPFIHTLDCMLVWNSEKGRWDEKNFSPKFFSRKQVPVAYVPKANCPRFLNDLLSIAMSVSDILMLQLYIGQCLLRKNISQMFLLLTGQAGAGKSTLLNIIEILLGVHDVTELRLQFFSRPFETSRLQDKSLLTVKDAPHDFLNQKNAAKIKSLTGGDLLSTEQKGQNEFYDITGAFNIIISMNSIPILYVQGDADAWKRRVLWVKYELPPVKEKIIGFDKILIEEEGAGILNWALGGAAELLKNGGIIKRPLEQEARVDMLMTYANPFEVFAKRFISPSPKTNLTTAEVVSVFARFCQKIDCPVLPDRKIQHLFNDYMRLTYGAIQRTDLKRGGKNKRGYMGYQLNHNKEL